MIRHHVDQDERRRRRRGGARLTTHETAFAIGLACKDACRDLNEESCAEAAAVLELSALSCAQRLSCKSSV
jgi:hypothetical protein